MKKYIALLVCIVCLVVPAAAQDAPADSAAVDSDSLLTAGMDRLLSYMLLTRDDFTFRDDYTPKDPYRLKIIDSLMAHPLLMKDFSEQFAGVMRQTPDSIGEYLVSLFGEGPPATACDVNSDLGIIKFDERLDSDLNGMFMIATLDHARRSTQTGCGDTSTVKKFVRDVYKELILDYPDYRIYTNEELDSLQQVEEEWAKEFAEMGVDIKNPEFPDVLFYSATFDKIKELYANDKGLRKKAKIGNPVLYLDTERGKLAIGTFGNDVYTGDYFMIIDPGGDDVYNLSYDIHKPHPTIIADFAGDDYYTAETDFVLASGALSFSLLIDYEGDDIYKGKNFSLGSGYFGVGILWDKKGNDNYYGDTFVQGAGTFGIGLLIDEDGSDTYTGNLQSQGFGFVRGIGGIADFGGNDDYIIQAKYKEYFHPGNHYTSLSQGFGIGVRPHMSGGFGFICDYGGNDSYIADFFTQASSYWWSLGLIYDKAGNDLYSSYQYAQGAGAHMTLGMLVDGAGDDVYRSHGVCQGCGHDYSCGWLLDKGGNDVYSAHDLAHGAGQANGIGIFTDLGGDDGYYTHNKHNTQGYGNPRRDYGSIGLFLDMAGDDRYGANGGNGQYWNVPGKWGGGLDWEDIIPVTDSTENK